jgi:hypothetical protein
MSQMQKAEILPLKRKASLRTESWKKVGVSEVCIFNDLGRM